MFVYQYKAVPFLIKHNKFFLWINNNRIGAGGFIPPLWMISPPHKELNEGQRLHFFT